MPVVTDVYAALTRKSGFEVLQGKESAGQLRFMGRSHIDRWNFFLLVIDKLLAASDNVNIEWTVDISKQYMRRDGLVLYGWRFIFQAPAISKSYESIISTIVSAPSPSRIELQSQLLPGYKPGDIRGGVNERGKGASAAGSVPMAMSRRR